MNNSNNQSNSSLSSVLNMFPMPTTNTNLNLPLIIEPTANVETDFNFARGNLYHVIEEGTQALTDLIQFAKATQSARTFEVVSTLINTLVIANEKLLDINKKNKDIQNMDADKDKNNTVNNNLYVTPNELLDMIKNKRDNGGKE